MDVAAGLWPINPQRWRTSTALIAAVVATGALSAAAASPALAEAPSPACNLYASTTGSDSNAGSATSPLRTIKTLIRRLQAGQTGCLAEGQTFNEGFTLYGGETNGAEGAPVTITSVNPEKPALINGRVVTEAGADWLTFTHLHFTFGEYRYPSPTVGSKHTTWTYDDVTAPTTICFNLISSSYGLAEHTVIEHDRIHGCGSQEKFVCNTNTVFCETVPNNGFFIHGVYVGGGKETIIRNNYFYENADRAVQIRSGSEGTVVEHNIMDGNGEGVIFGDGSSRATVRWNIITSSHSVCGEIAGCYDYAASEYNAVAPNLLANNDVYANQCAFSPPTCYPNKGNIEKMSHVTVEHNIEADPLYVNPSEHNYTLQPGSPALGYGPDDAQPTTTPPPETQPTTSPSPSPSPEGTGTTPESGPTSGPVPHGHQKSAKSGVAGSTTRSVAPTRTHARHRHRHHRHAATRHVKRHRHR